MFPATVDSAKSPKADRFPRFWRTRVKGLGGYDQARRVFGGQSALDSLIAGFNAVVFGQARATDAPSGDDRAAP